MGRAPARKTDKNERRMTGSDALTVLNKDYLDAAQNDDVKRFEETHRPFWNFHS